MSIFWSDYLKDFINSNNSYSTVLWNPNDSCITNQIESSINSNADVIFTDLLPSELPSQTTVHEYNFFINRFRYCPPYIPTLEKNTFKKENKVVIIDKNNSAFKNSMSLNLFTNLITLYGNYDVLYLEYEKICIKLLNNRIACAKEIILFSDSKTLVNYLLQFSIFYNRDFTTLPFLKNNVRLNGLGIQINTNSLKPVHTNLRDIFNHLSKYQVKTSLYSEDILPKLLSINDLQSLDAFSKHNLTNFYFRKIFTNTIEPQLWQYALSHENFKNRFERLTLHSILSSNYPTEDVLFLNTLETLLYEYFLSIADNYIYTEFDSVAIDVSNILKNYFERHEKLFISCIKNARANVKNNNNAFFSIIADCFLAIAYDQRCTKKESDYFLKNAYNFILLDTKNEKSVYEFYIDYNILINSLINNHTENFSKIRPMLQPFISDVYNPDILSKKNPNKFESLWYYKNLLRSKGYISLLSKSTIKSILSNSDLTDFLINYCNEPDLYWLKIILSRGSEDILEIYPNDHDSRTIAFHFCNKYFQNFSFSKFSSSTIEMNLESRENILQISLIDEEETSNLQGSEFYTIINSTNLLNILSFRDHIYNYSIYKLACITKHNDLNLLKRFSQSSNPLHYYLESQFEESLL